MPSYHHVSRCLRSHSALHTAAGRGQLTATLAPAESSTIVCGQMLSQQWAITTWIAGAYCDVRCGDYAVTVRRSVGVGGEGRPGLKVLACVIWTSRCDVGARGGRAAEAPRAGVQGYDVWMGAQQQRALAERGEGEAVWRKARLCGADQLECMPMAP